MKVSTLLLLIGFATAPTSSGMAAQSLHTIPLWGGTARSIVPIASVIDSVAVRVAAEDSTRAFLHRWRLAWFSDFNVNRNGDYATRQLRDAYAHCHERTVPLDEFASMVAKNYEVISGQVSAASKCPSWELGRDASRVDEADSIDAALTPAKRIVVHDDRTHLLEVLNNAQAALPSDAWIAGQRVRFLVDQGMLTEASNAAQACHADAWWCAALAGYVLQRQGSSASADSAFAVAGSALSPQQLCEWNDIHMLLPSKLRLAYIASSCVEQSRIMTRYWWLADPLFSVAGNERRAEHYARRVMVLLHSALDDDERFHWPLAYGGDAVAEMLIRFGWPTASYWIGREEDLSHDKYLQEYRSLSAAPYSTAEYSSGRVHFGALWSALTDPFHAGQDAWELNAPKDLRTTPKGRGDFWWPLEHMRPVAHVVEQLPEGQTAFFRRQRDVQRATSIDVAASTSESRTLSQSQMNATLVLSSAPDSFNVVQRRAQLLGKKITLSGFIASRRALLAVELQSNAPRAMMLRTRYAIDPPEPLDSLRSGTLAMSDPVFFAPSTTDALPASVDSMLPSMLGTTTITRGERVGVFWETYGVTETDSVTFSITASATSARSFMRRLASALKLSREGVTNVGMSWVDPRTRDRWQEFRRAVAILPRSLVLDLGSLPKGAYAIEVQVAVNGRAPVRAARTLDIR